MVGQLYGEETAAVLRSPNNTLAIAYLNAIEEMDSPLQPMTIPAKEPDTTAVSRHRTAPPVPPISGSFLRRAATAGE